jgi:2-(1,2-epoxy-1,2-dihydrophenyl)acetyl-CoA isomerase
MISSPRPETLMTHVIEASPPGPIQRIWLNRPTKRNALNQELVVQLTREMERAGADPLTRVVVLGGRGGAFSAGGDLDELEHAGDETRERLGEFHRLILAVVQCPVPVVVAWQGAAAGFGADLALAADLRLGDPTSFFQASFIHVGLVPDGGGTYFLPDLIGAGRAFDWLSLGDRIGANELEKLGILNRILQTTEFAEGVDEYVQRLSERPPLAVRHLKNMLFEGRRVRLLEALASSARAQLALLKSADFREGVAAFRGKRAPIFLGK